MRASRYSSRPFRAGWTVCLVATVMLAAASPAKAETAACDTAGSWFDPANGRRLNHIEILANAADHAVVLLGETHDDAEHHRWQLSTLAGVRAHTANLVLGFEAFPRRVQPVLDRWIAGELAASTFIDESQWSRVWAFNPDLYLPLFDFARLHQLPMVALNVERTLVAAVGEQGWQNVAEAQREGVGEPAPASHAYRVELAQVYRQHRNAKGQDNRSAPELDSTLEDPAFVRFVEAQLIWDRAMAEALAAAHRSVGTPTVVGIVGSGHLRRGHGIPHQLRALGIDDVMVLLPIAPGQPCEAVDSDAADAMFIAAPRQQPAPPRARLGIFIETLEQRVRITKVVADTVASRAGLVDGDIVIEAAGVSVLEHGQLISLIQRQAPGTWLPVTVERDGERLQVVAKFPVTFE